MKELAFKFLTYVQDEVNDVTLGRLLLKEYATILKNHVSSSQLYERILTDASQQQRSDQAFSTDQRNELFNSFFKAKQKKMNYEMMLLADCVTIFGDEAQWPQNARKELISYVKSVAEVAEIRAVAYHDIAVASTEASKDIAKSNLYHAWYLAMAS